MPNKQSGNIAPGAVTGSGNTGTTVFTSDADLAYPAAYDVYSGADIKAILHVPPDFIQTETEGAIDEQPPVEYSKPLILGDIQTLSYSIYREKYPVRSLGMGYPKGWTRGPRTISGTIIFTVFNKQPLYDILSRVSSDTSQDVSTPLIDQLPRFDITVTFSNEFGAASTLVIYGVELFSEGVTMSIEDYFTENVVQYMATDIRPMLPDTERMDRLKNVFSDRSASNYIKEKKLIYGDTAADYLASRERRTSRKVSE